MNARLWIAPIVLIALQVGCGKQDPPPRADVPPRAAIPATELDRVADDARRAVEREAQRMHEDWDRLTSDVKEGVNKVPGDLKLQIQKQRDEMAEFAAQMAEDAKDRALDIPDVLDEFFGAQSEHRRGSRPERSRRQ